MLQSHGLTAEFASHMAQSSRRSPSCSFGERVQSATLLAEVRRRRLPVQRLGGRDTDRVPVCSRVTARTGSASRRESMPNQSTDTPWVGSQTSLFQATDSMRPRWATPISSSVSAIACMASDMSASVTSPMQPMRNVLASASRPGKMMNPRLFMPSNKA